MTSNIPTSPIDTMEWFGHVDGPTLLVLPTTRATVEKASRSIRKDRFLVADPAVISQAINPAAYLCLCQKYEARGEWVPSAYVFTDQFVDAPFAALLVQREGFKEFMAATEVLARANYAVDVHVWTATGRISVPPLSAQDPMPVLRALGAYYNSCAGLGDEWLMRAQQRRRQASMRVTGAVRRLRLYESIVMQAFANDELHKEAQTLLREIGARRTNLMEMMGAER